MGKKKVVKKTKELSVAIAESSAMSGDSQQQKILPRKRGRPRKIIVKDEEEVSAELKKLKTSEVEESQGDKKKQEEEFEEDKNLQPQKQQPTRSRARRKSKPRKSC